MVIFAVFFFLELQILLGMRSWSSFISLLTIIVFVIWIFQIYKFHFKFSCCTCLFNQFRWRLCWLWILFFFFRSDLLDLILLDRNFRLGRLGWLSLRSRLNLWSGLSWLNCLYWNRLSNSLLAVNFLSCVTLNSFLNLLWLTNLLWCYLFNYSSLLLWSYFHNLYLSSCFDLSFWC